MLLANTTWIVPAFLVGCFFIFAATVAGVFLWNIHRRRERPPEAFKLRRGPGETLRRRVQKVDENLGAWLCGTAFAPLVLASLVVLVAVRLPRGLVLYGFIFSLLVGLTGFAFGGRALLHLLHRRRDDLLGYLGERAVGERLEPLLARGYRIFHDVPAVSNSGKRFNLDHVAVGPSGVVVVETKTRRKGRARPGFEEHEVVFDGSRLVWPWGEDTCGLTQAQAEADWLHKWIEQRTGLKTEVKAILALPGWMVRERKLGPVRVCNPKLLPAYVEGRGAVTLTAAQVDLIARQLDECCRDVED